MKIKEEKQESKWGCVYHLCYMKISFDDYIAGKRGSKELENTDHVGFVDTDELKGFINIVGCDDFDEYFLAIDNEGGYYGNVKEHDYNMSISMHDLIVNWDIKEVKPKTILVFDTRKDLFRWLAED